MHPGLVELPLDIPALLAAVADPGCGAQAVFIGRVRDRDDPQGGREVVAIEYSAYTTMAEKVLGRIAVGEASIAIVAASPRRDAALAAVRAALERVKSEAPIWKREIYADGGARWREDEALAPTGPPGGGSS